jgi:hypothetical protein
LTARSCTEDMLPILASINKLSHAPSAPYAVIALFAAAALKISSRPITEKGGCHNSVRDRGITSAMIGAEWRQRAHSTSALGYLEPTGIQCADAVRLLNWGSRDLTPRETTSRQEAEVRRRPWDRSRATRSGSTKRKRRGG